MVGGGDVFGGATGGLLFNVLYDVLKELISKSMIYRPLLQNILSALDSYGPVIEQIEASNEELGLPKEEVEKFKAHMEEGIEIVRKCSKVRKWNIYKKYKYANKLLGWDGALVRQFDELKAQGVRDGRKTLVSVKQIERVVTGIETSSIILEAGVAHIATTSRHMEKALSGVEMRSGDTAPILQPVSRRSQNWTGNRSYVSWGIVFMIPVMVSMVMAPTGSTGTKWFVFNFGINYLGINNY